MMHDSQLMNESEVKKTKHILSPIEVIVELLKSLCVHCKVCICKALLVAFQVSTDIVSCILMSGFISASFGVKIFYLWMKLCFIAKILC